MAVDMQTMIELPDPILSKSEQMARSQGVSLQEFIVQALEEKVLLEPEPSPHPQRVELPLIRSKNPGKLDLTDFDFDDLLT